MELFNKYLQVLKPYKLASHKVWSITPEQRKNVLKLDWNEATIPPTPRVMEAINSLLAEPSFFNLYPSTNNTKILDLLSKYIDLPNENIQYFASSDVLHQYLCKVFVEVGDTVLILGPTYDNFRLTCEANGARIQFFKYTEDFTFDKAAFKDTIKKLTPSFVYICNPNNPTGNIHEPSYVESLLQEFPCTMFLIDEAYGEFSGITCKELVTKYENILVTRTMSKAFALANFRLGYLISSKNNIDIVNKIRNPKNVSTFAQVAMEAALSDIDYMKNYVSEVTAAKKFFIAKAENFSKHFKVFPSSGNFLLLKFNSYEEKILLLNYLADNDIFARDTTQDEIVRNCFRITIGTTEQMKLVLSKIEQYYCTL